MANVKISSFSNASTNMASADRVTGLQGGVNVNFSQSQILTGTNGTTGGPIKVTGGAGTAGNGGYAYLYGGYGYNGRGGSVFVEGGIGYASPGGTLKLYAGSAIGPGDGGGVLVSGGNANSTGAFTNLGGPVTIYGGYSKTGDGGNILIKSGDTGSVHSGGSLKLYGGNSTSGQGGEIYISSGSTSGAVDGSSLYLFGGHVNSASNRGGHVFIRPGSNSNAGGNEGNVYIGGNGPGLDSSTYIKGRNNGQVYMGIPAGPALFAYGTGQIHLRNTGSKTIYVNIPSSASGIASGGLYTSSGVVKVKP